MWATGSFLTLSFAGQADSPGPVVEIQGNKTTIQRLDLALYPRKLATHSAVLF